MLEVLVMLVLLVLLVISDDGLVCWLCLYAGNVLVVLQSGRQAYLAD